MGKASIVQHLGEGEYRVTLLRDTSYLDRRVAALATQIAEGEAKLQELSAAEQAAYDAVKAAWAAIDALIREIEASNQPLMDALQDAINALNAVNSQIDGLVESIAQQRADQAAQLAAYDAELAALEELLEQAATEEQRQQIQAQIDDVEDEREAYKANTDQAVAESYVELDEAKELRKQRQKAVEGAQEAWNKRKQRTQEVQAAVDAAIPLQTAYLEARNRVGLLQMRLASQRKERQWLLAHKGTNPEVSAWCADLTENLEGDVATIEIPGERAGVPVLVRPGYNSRAVWQATEQHAAQVDAVAAAQSGILKAESGVDLLRTNIAQAKARRDQSADYLEAVSARIPPVPALILAAQAQLDTAEESLALLEAKLPAAEQAVTTARTTYVTALNTLQSARAAAVAPDASPEPRMADGRLQPIASTSPWAAFWNRTVLPAWQKWKPTYRLATITDLAGDLCTVDLDAATSSQQDINVNREMTLTDVPIVYMECNGEAFDVGDRVVVEFSFHDQTKPRVIGFESHPKPCGLAMRFIFEAKARTQGGPNYAPQSFGRQAYTPTEEHPTQPPSEYAPFGYWPKDVAEPLEYVTIQGTYGPTTSWTASHRVTRETLAWGNRRFFAWDGINYKGCMSWPGKSVMGDGWLTRSAVYAGAYYGDRISDYMIEQSSTVNCNAYQIVWNGRVALNWQSLSPIQYAAVNRIVAACAVKRTIDEVTAWRIRFVIFSANEWGPVVNPTSGYGRPNGWLSDRQYCRPSNAVFRVFEAPLDGPHSAEKLAATVQIGADVPAHEDLWIPNIADTSFDINYIDSTSYNRPEQPMGAFSADGSACTILAFGGTFYDYTDNWQSSIRWHVGVVGVCRLAFSGDAVTPVWALHASQKTTISSKSLAADYSTATQAVAATRSGEQPIAVDYDGSEEVLLWHRWSGDTSSRSGWTGTEIYNDYQSPAQHTVSSSNGKISSTWTDTDAIALSVQGNVYTHASTRHRRIFQEVDLVSGHWMGFDLIENYDEDASGHGIATTELSRTINVLRDGQTLYTATNPPLVLRGAAGSIRGDYASDVLSLFDTMEPGDSFEITATELDDTVDVSSGYLDLYHYGKGPAWMHARDPHNNTLTVLAYNQWAPYLSIQGSWYENGGFRPNTTQHQVFWSPAGSFESLVSWSAISAMDETVYSLGFI